MNNFRRRASAKKQRTVTYTEYVMTSVRFSNIVVTNGSFTIDNVDNDTAPLQISVNYNIIKTLVTHYSDGTQEYGTSTTYTGTHTFTEFRIITDFFQYCELLPVITLPDNTTYPVSLHDPANAGENGEDIQFPSQTGGELDSYVNLGYHGDPSSPRDLKVHVKNQGSNYALTITKV